MILRHYNMNKLVSVTMKYSCSDCFNEGLFDITVQDIISIKCPKCQSSLLVIDAIEGK